MARLKSLLHNLLRRDRVERELDEEMRAMLDLLAIEKIRGGMEPAAARRAAALELGIESVKVQVRESRAGVSIDSLARDVRYAVRLLVRNPLFALTAALSLAIGIGADTAVFTIADALLRFSPEAVAEPARLVEIGRAFDGLPFGFNPASYPDYLDIRRRTTALEHVFAHPLFPKTMSLAAQGGVEEVVGDVVTTNYFAALGTRAAIGRVFDAGESDLSGASPFVVLSHRFWMRKFGGDPAIVGTTVRLNRYPMTVVGVAPEGFQGTTIVDADLWVPMSMVTFVTGSTPDQMEARRAGWLVMGGRLKPGVSLAQAAADLNAIDRALRAEFSSSQNIRGAALRVQPASPVAGNGPVAAAFVALLAALTSTVLVIACANVAGLLLARAAGRRREMALRLAIGAARTRLVRQLLTETMLLFAIGAVLGVGLARVMALAMASVLPTLPIPVHVSIGLDWRALAFAMSLSLGAALLSGLAPALHASRTDVSTVLKDESHGPRLRLRSAFVVSQVALSLLLVIIGGLFLRTIQSARSTDAGFDARNVEVAPLDLSLAGYTSTTGPGFVRDLLDRVRAVPGVQGASLAQVLPLATETLGIGLSLPGAQPLPGQVSADVAASGNIVEPGYFAALQIPLLSGRDFTRDDAEGAPLVAIVGEAAARRFWPRQDPIGQPIVVNGGGRVHALMQVVGVARDLQYSSFGNGGEPYVYLPFRQNYRNGTTIVVRTSNGRRVGNQLRSIVTGMNASLPQPTARPLEDVLAVGLLPQRLGAAIAGGLGILGILLAAIGVYGVTAYAVAQRTREIAIRSALGAPRRVVVTLAMKHAIALAGIGSLIGLALAAVAGQVLSMLLVGVSPIDPVTFLATVVMCALVVLAACYVPVHRAVRIAAADALRTE
ncbi:MAG TPA: ABC transporter permease [Vicinamibacterales bacterium]|jgi:predicted permease